MISSVEPIHEVQSIWTIDLIRYLALLHDIYKRPGAERVDIPVEAMLVQYLVCSRIGQEVQRFLTTRLVVLFRRREETVLPASEKGRIRFEAGSHEQR